MEVLRLTTDDYVLSVRADGVEKSYKRASSRSSNLEISTRYTFSGCIVDDFRIASIDGVLLTEELWECRLDKDCHPVFFENKTYFFDLIFDSALDSEPSIYTPLKEISESFIVRRVSDKYFLTGAVNFGNDIGKSELVIRFRREGNLFIHTFGFEVFPVKLDFKSDYKSIVEDINNEFSSLVFDMLRKTYAGFRQEGAVKNDIVWWSIFGRLYPAIIKSTRFILAKPHKRLSTEDFYLKADRIKKVDTYLEEQIVEYRGQPHKRFKIKEKSLTYDTSENRFIKHALNAVLRKYVEIKDNLIQVSNSRITTEFKSDLEIIETDLKSLAFNPFFRQVGDFRGIRQESLVLSQASGYSYFFRSWIILKKGIQFLDGITRMEMKNIAELYQIWCFLEMKNAIQRIIGKEPEDVNLAEILIEGFTIQLLKGNKSKVTFRRENGDLIELFHELRYSGQPNEDALTHTVNQEPDIVLRITKNDLYENLKMTYLFDAKYRLASDDEDNRSDLPPDDAINQMHRYRDAIYYQSPSYDDRPKKEVIGAFVLFPGAEDADIAEGRYFQKSIPMVNIGAFPLIPGAKKQNNASLLNTYLFNILNDRDSVQILREGVIPYKALRYEEPDAYVLAGFISGKHQKTFFESGSADFYHMPMQKDDGSSITVKNLDKIRYFCPIIDGIESFFEVSEITVLPRKEINIQSENPASNQDKPYYVFRLKNRRPLPKKIKSVPSGNRIFRYARLSDLYRCESIGEFNMEKKQERLVEGYI
jgi:hypothetical protein